MFSGSPPKADFYLRVSRSARRADAPRDPGASSWRRVTTADDVGASAGDQTSPARVASVAPAASAAVTGAALVPAA
jgi:hypothetical protein